MAPLQFGILMVPYQTIDVAGPLDILSACSKTLIGPYEAGGVAGTAGMTEKAIDIQFHHISETMEPVPLTAGFKAVPSTTCDDCPPLDYLLIGGPDPFAYRLSDHFAEFLQAHVKAGKGIFTTCTGGWAISLSGVLNGKNATTNHGALPIAYQTSPDVNWQEKQWVVDGQFWTAAGACAGMDMMAHWVIENYGIEVARFGFQTLDYEPRDIDGLGNRVLPPQHGVATA
ncbi:Cyclohexyl-isocyanide Hydratase [Hyphodiscus hymeniophilus]|uniref:Cyclohexyl-isocyanide Hydratase n=1 Tax=Hyphodiscus hymeniophilus TaxID=353542 RepID=A0A9P6VKV2_9HELO|nr:Cyclohexyl-isocyanide Hydratase [Hyphodiscus hymeniophilus]